MRPRRRRLARHRRALRVTGYNRRLIGTRCACEARCFDDTPLTGIGGWHCHRWTKGRVVLTKEQWSRYGGTIPMLVPSWQARCRTRNIDPWMGAIIMGAAAMLLPKAIYSFFRKRAA